MFDSDYSPSCTVNFETIRGDFKYVSEKRNRGTLQTVIRLHEVVVFSFFFSAGFFRQQRSWCCGFAQQHLARSWVWHWLKCYKHLDPRKSNRFWTEEEPLLLFCLWMSTRPPTPPPSNLLLIIWTTWNVTTFNQITTPADLTFTGTLQ